MHVYFSGIGGTGIGPLAMIAKQAGYVVSGSDKQASQYIEYLKKQGIANISIEQSADQIAEAHAKQPIDWFVYSSALPKENPQHPELVFCQSHGIKTTKRDELLNLIISEKQLKLIAIAGTHGKTTTTAMVIWLLKQLGVPLSYSVGAKISYGEMGHYDAGSKYFVYECDEFDRNFLAFHPYLSLITGVTWDHHEIFTTQQDYFEAFEQFFGQSQRSIMWQQDAERLSLVKSDNISVLSESSPEIAKIVLPGRLNRQDGWLALQAVHELTNKPISELTDILNKFPGVSRRFEKIAENLFSDYAHTPEKITGLMSVAQEQASTHNQKLVIIYEPLTNRRMHYMKQQHAGLFEGADKIYWVPSYLAREDPKLEILSPKKLISFLAPQQQAIAQPALLDVELKHVIEAHLAEGDMVVGLSGGGGNSLDQWLRINFSAHI